MKVMVIVKASPESERGEMPSEQLLKDMGNYNEELVKAGIMLAGEGLHPTMKGKRVRFSGKERTVIDGPFAETKELLAGFWMWRVKSMDEAVEWLKKAPFDGGTEIEMRPVFEAEDFGESFTPELREQEASIRAQALKLSAVRFENASEKTVAGLNGTFTFSDTSGIPTLWNQFAPQMASVPGRQGKASYGVSWNCTKDGFDYLAAVEVGANAKLPNEYTQVKLPARRYAIFTHTEHISKIKQTFDTICHQWVPDCGLHVANAPWLERYTESFDGKTGLGGLEIWVPLDA
jgi:AraC family transcriptional regulator